MNYEQFCNELFQRGLDPRKVLGHEQDDYLKEFDFFYRYYDSKWELFHWERGQISQLKLFKTESDILTFVLNEIDQNQDCWADWT